MAKTLNETLTRYGIVLPNAQMANSFNLISGDVFQTIYDNHASLSALITNPGHLLDVAKFLRGNDNGVGRAGRMTDLNFANVTLGDALRAIPANVPPLLPLRLAHGLVLPGLHPHIMTFYRSRAGGTRLRDFVNLTAPIAGHGLVATTQNILAIIASVVQAVLADDPTYNSNYPSIARPALLHLQYMHANHPPGAEFPGFARWGEGNHATVSSNIRWHFMKHVLHMDEGEHLSPLTAELLVAQALSSQSSSEAANQRTAEMMEMLGAIEDDPTTPDEAAAWWRELNILLPKAVCDEYVKDSRDRAKMAGWYLNDVLAHGHVAHFAASGILGRSPRLVGYLVSRYENAYRDFALARSAAFTTAFVSSNGAKVFIAGAEDDNFIIGRIDSTGQLGISSCYKPTDLQGKLDGAKDGFMWPVA